LTGTIQLKDNVTLHLDDKAVILGSTDAEDYRNLDPFLDGTGKELGYALIVTLDAKNVGLEGPGTIDGQGKALAVAEGHFTIRPFLIRWVQCSNVSLQDVHLRNPGAWTNAFFQCDNVTVTNVTIRSRDSGLANNDGLDIDSCQNVHIQGCDIVSGDDSLCFKATSRLPCGNITATGCRLSTRCNGIKLGTESLGDFEHIQVSQCQLHDVGLSGIALNSVDGAHLHDVTISNITMDDVTVPISVRLGARLKTFRTGDQAKPVGELNDVTIANVRATGVKQIGMLVNGIPGHPVESLTLENIDLQLPGGGTAANAQVQLPEKANAYPEYSMFGKVFPAYGLYLRHVNGVTFQNIHLSLLKPDARPAMVLVDVAGVTPAGFTPVVTPAPANSVSASP
jgi:polygalacturonase